MKAVWIERTGGPEVLEYGDRPCPELKGDEVLVRVKACGLNHLDVWVRRGKSFPRPIVPGSDIVGVVEKQGAGVRGSHVGREVVVFPGFADEMSVAKMRGYLPVCTDFGMLGAHRDGGCAELAAVPAESLLDKPPQLGWHEAACLPIAFMTAWHMLFDRGQLQPGETVLIHSAGSGVGHGAIQMAHMVGARVIATSGSAEKLAKARELGADEVINYNEEDVAGRVREFTGGRGVDVVLDHNGAVTWEASLKSLAKGGRLVICGVTQGARVTFDLGALFYQAQSILGSTIGRCDELHKVIQVVAAGRVQPIINRVFPLSDIRAAHERLESPERFGKIIMEMG